MAYKSLEDKKRYNKEYQRRRYAFDASYRRKIVARVAKRRAASPEGRVLADRGYYARHRETILERKKDPKVKSRVAERSRDRWATDFLYKLRKLIRNRVRTALKRREVQQPVPWLGCTIEALKVHIETQFQPGMTWANHGEWHLDHIRPLAAFNLRSSTALVVACHYSNLQPLWKKDNLAKAAKIDG